MPIDGHSAGFVTDPKAADVAFREELPCDAPSKRDFNRGLPAALRPLRRRLLEGSGIVLRPQLLGGRLYEPVEEFREQRWEPWGGHDSARIQEHLVKANSLRTLIDWEHQVVRKPAPPDNATPAVGIPRSDSILGFAVAVGVGCKSTSTEGRNFLRASGFPSTARLTNELMMSSSRIRFAPLRSNASSP